MTSVNGVNYNIYQGGICQQAGMPVNGGQSFQIPGQTNLYSSYNDPMFGQFGPMCQSNGPSGIDSYPNYDQDDCNCMPFARMGNGNGINGFQLMGLFQMMMGFLSGLWQQGNPAYTSSSSQTSTTSTSSTTGSSTNSTSTPVGWYTQLCGGSTMNIHLNSQMGTLEAGQNYSMTFNQQTGGYTATGLNGGNNQVGTWTYSDPIDHTSLIDVWGCALKVQQDPTSGQISLVDPNSGNVVGSATMS